MPLPNEKACWKMRDHTDHSWVSLTTPPKAPEMWESLGTISTTTDPLWQVTTDTWAKLPYVQPPSDQNTCESNAYCFRILCFSGLLYSNSQIIHSSLCRLLANPFFFFISILIFFISYVQFLRICGFSYFLLIDCSFCMPLDFSFLGSDKSTTELHLPYFHCQLQFGVIFSPILIVLIFYLLPF